MIYLAAEHRFAIVVYRFRWEDAGEERVSGAIYERIRCGISFDRSPGCATRIWISRSAAKCSIYWRSKHRESM